jgi:hypothetical protein
VIPPPNGKTIATSPLRFTWEYDTPSYYAPGPEPAGDAVAVIASHADQPLPDRTGAGAAHLRLIETFAVSDGIFRFKTFVRVYRRQ